MEKFKVFDNSAKSANGFEAVLNEWLEENGVEVLKLREMNGGKWLVVLYREV